MPVMLPPGQGTTITVPNQGGATPAQPQSPFRESQGPGVLLLPHEEQPEQPKPDPKTSVPAQFAKIKLAGELTPRPPRPESVIPRSGSGGAVNPRPRTFVPKSPEPELPPNLDPGPYRVVGSGSLEDMGYSRPSPTTSSPTTSSPEDARRAILNTPKPPPGVITSKPTFSSRITGFMGRVKSRMQAINDKINSFGDDVDDGEEDAVPRAITDKKDPNTGLTKLYKMRLSMHDEQHFIDAIASEPHDYSHQGVYSDWLREQGREEDADKIQKGLASFQENNEGKNGYATFHPMEKEIIKSSFKKHLGRAFFPDSTIHIDKFFNNWLPVHPNDDPNRMLTVLKLHGGYSIGEHSRPSTEHPWNNDKFHYIDNDNIPAGKPHLLHLLHTIGQLYGQKPKNSVANG